MWCGSPVSEQGGKDGSVTRTFIGEGEVLRSEVENHGLRRTWGKQLLECHLDLSIDD